MIGKLYVELIWKTRWENLHKHLGKQFASSKLFEWFFYDDAIILKYMPDLLALSRKCWLHEQSHLIGAIGGVVSTASLDPYHF